MVIRNRDSLIPQHIYIKRHGQIHIADNIYIFPLLQQVLQAEQQPLPGNQQFFFQFYLSAPDSFHLPVRHLLQQLHLLIQLIQRIVFPHMLFRPVADLQKRDACFLFYQPKDVLGITHTAAKKRVKKIKGNNFGLFNL
nr:hypothetical protein [uncultured Acetatifactor sp.]